MAGEPPAVPLVRGVLRHHARWRVRRDYRQSALEGILGGQEGLHGPRLRYRAVRKPALPLYRTKLENPASDGANEFHCTASDGQFFADGHTTTFAIPNQICPSRHSVC